MSALTPSLGEIGRLPSREQRLSVLRLRHFISSTFLRLLRNSVGRRRAVFDWPAKHRATQLLNT